MYKRFKWDEAVRWYPPAWDLVDTLKEPHKIFVGSTFELFHSSLPENWMEYNLLTAKKYPQHTFIFLTKQPQNLIKWSPFPDNCWVGVSATTTQEALHRVSNILYAIEAKVKFLSLEPLLSWDTSEFIVKIENSFMGALNWLIIGQQTPASVKTAPKVEWISELVETADSVSVPVFLKNNLRSLLPAEAPFVTNPLRDNEFYLRQEFPLIKRGIE
jgi:protein gp37